MGRIFNKDFDSFNIVSLAMAQRERY